MSLNLTLNEGKNGPEIPLWQTPTWFTLACLSHNPETDEFDGGHNGARRRYIKWVESHTSGVWKNSEDLEREKKESRVTQNSSILLKNPTFRIFNMQNN
jgi:hypothetical protein